jgi:hypothetical protein
MPDYTADGFQTGAVALQTGEPALRGPAAVTVHYYSYVAGVRRRLWHIEVYCIMTGLR